MKKMKTTELVDLNLVTYVIMIKPDHSACKNDDSLLYVALNTEYDRKDFGRDEEDIGKVEDAMPFATTNLINAAIFETPSEAKRIGKLIHKSHNPRVVPISKKVFFKAKLEGLR